MGYWRAGFDVTGVDLVPQPNYPFEFHQADALDFPLDGYHAIHASPPCQMFSQLAGLQPDIERVGLINPTRARLEASGLPYVIENVANAPLRPDLVLCGLMFGRQLYRHRLFETNAPMIEPDHPEHVVPTCKGRWKPGKIMTVAGHFSPVAHARQIMAISWTSRDELAEAIPPYFTEYIGGFLIQAVRGEIALEARSYRDEMAAFAPLPAPSSEPLLPTYTGPVYRWEDVRPPPRPGLPRGALAPTQAAILMAVTTDYRPTTRSIAAALGLSVSYVHVQLQELKAAGLVSWEPNLAGTLRSRVGFVVSRQGSRDR